jgi:hypothetical protein
MNNGKQVFGTQEWAVKNANFINGCHHNCKYCYSKEMAIRFKRKTPSNWQDEEVDNKQMLKKWKRVDGMIMFPSSHDITPVNLQLSIEFLQNLLKSGNEVLIVTKPHYSAIKEICNRFIDYKSKILFRFTLALRTPSILKYWEPNAPSFAERKRSLIYAYKNGFLPVFHVNRCLIIQLRSWLKHYCPTIQIPSGLAKQIFFCAGLKLNGFTDDETFSKANELIALQSDINIKKLYNKLKSNEKIKWKESIKKVC